MRNQRTLRTSQAAANLNARTSPILSSRCAHEAALTKNPVPGKTIPPSTLPTKCPGALPAAACKPACQLVAIDLFSPTESNRRGGVLCQKLRGSRPLHINANWTGVGFRIHVAPTRSTHGNGRPWRSEQGAPAPRDHRLPAFEQTLCHGHHRASISPSDHPVGRRSRPERRHVERAVFFRRKACRRDDHMVITSLTRARSRRQAWRCMPRRLGGPHSADPRAKLARQAPARQHTAFDLGAWRVVRNGVNGAIGDHGILSAAKRGELKILTPPVLARFAGTVRKRTNWCGLFTFVAIRTLGERGFDKKSSPAWCSSVSWNASFWVRPVITRCRLVGGLYAAC